MRWLAMPCCDDRSFAGHPEGRSASASRNAEWQAHHTSVVWGELEFCTSHLDMTSLLIGDEIFLGDDSTKQGAAKLHWWARQGQKVLRAYSLALKGQLSRWLLHKDNAELPRNFTSIFAR